jgi:hypothetical protein
MAISLDVETGDGYSGAARIRRSRRGRRRSAARKSAARSPLCSALIETIAKAGMKPTPKNNARIPAKNTSRGIAFIKNTLPGSEFVCSVADIHTLSGFIAGRCPEYLDWCAQLRAVKSKRLAPTPVCYLEKLEFDALLDAPTPVTRLGYRDRALLVFLYNSGAQAEGAKHSGADGASSSVCLHGKGDKVRICPLLASTTVTLRNLVARRNGRERVFLNRRSEPLTRFGIHEIVTRCARVTMSRVPELRKKRDRPSHHPPHHSLSSSSRQR